MTLFTILRHSARMQNRGDHCPRRHFYLSVAKKPDLTVIYSFDLTAVDIYLLISIMCCFPSIETEVVSWLFQRPEYNVCEGIKYRCNRRRKNINCNRLFGCQIEAQITVELWGPLYDRALKMSAVGVISTITIHYTFHCELLLCTVSR